MSEDTTPGTGVWLGKVYLIDPGRYQAYQEEAAKYSALWDSEPGDSDLMLSHGTHAVRQAGVMLVDRQGRDRKQEDISADARVRLSYLRHVKAPAECIRACAALLE